MRQKDITTVNGEAPGRSLAMLLLVLALPLLLVMFAVAFFLNVIDLQLDSRLYPQLTIVVLVTALAVQLIADVRGWMQDEAHPRVRDIAAKWRKTGATVVLTCAFIVGIDTIGFYFAVVLYVVLMLLALGVRKPLPVVLYTAGSVAFSYLLFEVLLDVALPTSGLGL